MSGNIPRTPLMYPIAGLTGGAGIPGGLRQQSLGPRVPDVTGEGCADWVVVPDAHIYKSDGAMGALISGTNDSVVIGGAAAVAEVESAIDARIAELETEKTELLRLIGFKDAWIAELIGKLSAFTAANAPPKPTPAPDPVPDPAPKPNPFREFPIDRRRIGG